MLTGYINGWETQGTGISLSNRLNDNENYFKEMDALNIGVGWESGPVKSVNDYFTVESAPEAWEINDSYLYQNLVYRPERETPRVILLKDVTLVNLQGLY